MNHDTSPTPMTDQWCALAVDADISAVLELARSFERELAEKTAENQKLRELCEDAIESLGDQYFCHESGTWKANKTKLKLREKLTKLTK